MNCPRCSTELVAIHLGAGPHVQIDECPKCKGQWFDRGEINALDDSVWTDVESLAFAPDPSVAPTMPCPVCVAQGPYRDRPAMMKPVVAERESAFRAQQ